MDDKPSPISLVSARCVVKPESDMQVMTPREMLENNVREIYFKEIQRLENALSDPKLTVRRTCEGLSPLAKYFHFQDIHQGRTSTSAGTRSRARSADMTPSRMCHLFRFAATGDL